MLRVLFTILLTLGTILIMKDPLLDKAASLVQVPYIPEQVIVVSYV